MHKRWSDHYDSNIVFKTRHAIQGSWQYTTARENMRIQHNGTVGIGTTNPRGRLDVIYTTDNIVGDYQDTSAVLNIYGGEDKDRYPIVTMAIILEVQHIIGIQQWFFTQPAIIRFNTPQVVQLNLLIDLVVVITVNKLDKLIYFFEQAQGTHIIE